MATIKGIWVFNDTIDLSTCPYHASAVQVNFETAGTTFERMYQGSDYDSGDPTLVYGDRTTCAYHSTGGHDSNGVQGWVNEGYKTVNFGSIEQEVSDELYTWLAANATQQIRIVSVDLTTLNLSEGTHIIKVKAKAEDYADSGFSNEVSYEIAGNTGYSITFLNPVHYYESDDLAEFTFYINDTAYTGSALTALGGQTITDVKTIGCSSTSHSYDYQYVFCDEVSLGLSSYGGTLVTHTLTCDLTAIGFGQHSCLDINTVVSMYDGSSKLLGEIEVGDTVKSWDFENNVAIGKEITSTNLYKPKAFRTAIPYYKLTFSDGTVIKHAATHRFYNVEQKAFVYTIYWNIGEHTYKEDGSYVSLVSMESINEPLIHGMITMDDYTCYFANGLMTGDRRCASDIVIGDGLE